MPKPIKIVSKKAADMIQQMQTTLNLNGGDNSYQSYGVVYSDDTDNYYRPSAACFAGLMSLYRQYKKDKLPKAEVIVVGVNKNLVKEEVRFEFMEYLANHSPMRDCFITKDAAEITQNAYLECDPSQCSNLLANALVATRTLVEGGNRLKSVIWLDLVKAGVDPHLAFASCFSFKASSDLPFKDDRSESKLILSGGSHCMMQPTNRFSHLDNTRVFNYVNNKQSNQLEAYSDILLYNNVQNLWGNQEDPAIKKKFDFFKAIEDGMKSADEKPNKKKASANPFAKAPAREQHDPYAEKSCNYVNGIEAIAENLKKLKW